MKRKLFLISALSAALLASCGGGNGSQTQGNADLPSAAMEMESDWTPPTDTIISKVWDALKKTGDDYLFGDDTPKIWSTTMMGVATENEERLIACYQRDSIWLVIAQRWGHRFYYYNENTGGINLIPEQELRENFPELVNRDRKLGYYKNCFIINNPMYEGAVTYTCTKKGFERSVSDNYCEFLFLDDDVKCDASAFDALVGPDFEKIPNGVRLKTSKFGLRHTTECVTEYVASTLGTPINEALGYQLHTNFPGPFYDWHQEYDSDGKYVVEKTLFVNTDKKIMGIVRMKADGKNFNISEMTLETIPYTLDNYPFLKVECHVDYRKPVYTYVLGTDGCSDYVIDYRIYNAGNELIEHYWTEDDVYDQPVINHYAFYYRHDGKIDTVNRSGMEGTEFDFRNENYNVMQDGIFYCGSYSHLQIPQRFDETKYDDHDRLIYSKYKATYSKDEWQIWEVRYKYVDDYCIKTVKTTERRDESEYCEDCDGPSYNTVTDNYTIREYYLRMSYEPEMTMRQDIESALLREIFDLLPTKNCEFNELNPYAFSDNMYKDASVGREGDYYIYSYCYWVKPLSDGRVWVMYDNYEENDETVHDDKLYTYIYANGKLTLSTELLPSKEQIAKDFGLDEADIPSPDFSSDSYDNLQVEFMANGENFTGRYKWNGNGFAIVNE